MKSLSAGFRCGQIGTSPSDAVAASWPNVIAAAVLVGERQPERGPVPSTSILGNARRSRSLRRCRIRSASVSG